MARYSLRFRDSVAKDLRAIPRKDISRILRRFDQLAEDPRAPGSEKLAEQDRYRVRQGDYRIIYEIRDEVLVVVVVQVGNRREVYRKRRHH
ncbi:MAG: type II toxin-antitoxin system RelE/ParE family toxin [Deltaproteobacteria bacterium]|nr:type II toxin-antitoxin system RelE/ParE family toxin [Deltaproteobacteria bacterium]